MAIASWMQAMKYEGWQQAHDSNPDLIELRIDGEISYRLLYDASVNGMGLAHKI